MPFTIEDIAMAVEEIPVQGGDSYLRSYREFINYFGRLNLITSHEFIVGSHFVYGWMPRILTLREPEGGYAVVTSILNKAKNGECINSEQLVILRNVVNNSMVGVSKLLHFVNPHKYAIWDGRVFKFINGRRPYDYQTRNPMDYLSYLENCREVVSDQRFHSIHERVNVKIGYEVTSLRAVEWPMFMRGGD